MAVEANIERPFIDLTAAALVEKARSAVESLDYAEATLCWEEATFRRKKTLKRVAAELMAGEVGPVEWLRKAEMVAKAHRKGGRGNHHIYVVLLKGFAANSRYGVYVGESRYLPAKRFAQHKSGIRAAGSVKRKGVCLLPSLYRHLNPLPKTEAKQLEKDLAAAFKAAGIPTRGGH